MAKLKLTKKRIDGIPANGKRQYLYDQDLPGFGLHVGATGSKSFFLEYKLGGRGGLSRRMTIGKYGRLTPDQARKEAKRLLGEVAQGIDVLSVKRSALKSKIDRPTYSKLWEIYKENKPGLKGIVTDENRFQNHIKPFFGNKTPKEICPLDIDRLRVKLLKTHQPGTVKNVLELLRRITNFAINKNLCPPPNFKIKLPKVDNIKTEDLDAEQLSNLWRAIEQDEDIFIANFMRMVLYTGMRRGELFRLKWEHIDFERGFIRLVDPKGGQEAKIPLNEGARALLESHPHIGSPFVFPGRGGGQRKDIIKQVNRIKDRAGLPKDFRALHGLRHVYASVLASSGEVDMYTLQKLLTHKGPIMTQRYAHLGDEPLRKAAHVASELMGPKGKEAKISRVGEK